MKQVLCKNNLLDSDNNLQLVQNAVKKNLGVSIPFLVDIVHHIVASHNNQTRTLVLLQSANLFNNPDQAIIDIGSTIEYLHAAAMSVSYTHLRAHETRGNLLCRLLL